MWPWHFWVIYVFEKTANLIESTASLLKKFAIAFCFDDFLIIKTYMKTYRVGNKANAEYNNC